MWEVGDCVFCDGTCGEPILDNRSAWVAGVCASPVAGGVVDSVLAAGLVAGAAESPVDSGLNQVCWVVVWFVGPCLVDQMTFCSFLSFLVGLVHLIFCGCVVV